MSEKKEKRFEFTLPREVARTIVTMDTVLIGFFAAFLGIIFTSEYFRETNPTLYLTLPIWIISTIFLFLVSIVSILHGLIGKDSPEGFAFFIVGYASTMLGFASVIIGLLVLGFIISIITGAALLVIVIFFFFLFLKIFFFGVDEAKE